MNLIPDGQNEMLEAALKERDEAREQLASCKKQYALRVAELGEYDRKLREAQGQLREIAHYANHEATCGLYDERVVCTCQLPVDLLAAATEGTP